MKLKFLILIMVLVVGIGISFLFNEQAEAPVVLPESEVPIAVVEFVCNNKQTFTARYFEGDSKATTSSSMPLMTGRVALELSDGRSVSLSQTISGSGIRYSNGDPNTEGSETFVFWLKGDGALILENNEPNGYIDCVATAPATAELPNIYHDGQNSFTVRYPEGWAIDPTYTNPATGTSSPTFHDLKFVVDAAFASGTNLSANDTGIAIEMAETDVCSAEAFTDDPVTSALTIINGREYSVATSSGAGAGNFYEEYFYALPSSRPCLGIHYLIHSTNIGNYEPGTKVEFDRPTLLQTLDSIRDSFRLAQ